MANAIATAPAATYYWVRSYLSTSLFAHRKQWLASKSTRFGRGGSGVKVSRVQDGEPPIVRPRDVIFFVAPAARRVSPENAAVGVARLRAEVFTGSEVMQAHQEGAVIRPIGQWLALPVGRERSVAAWRKKNPRAKLVLIKGVKPRLAQRTKTKRGKVKLRTKFLLVKNVTLPKTLQLYESWDSLDSMRSADLGRVADRILKDVANGLKA